MGEPRRVTAARPARRSRAPPTTRVTTGSDAASPERFNRLFPGQKPGEAGWGSGLLGLASEILLDSDADLDLRRQLATQLARTGKADDHSCGEPVTHLVVRRPVIETNFCIL